MNNKVNIKTDKAQQANDFDPYEPRVGPDFYREVASRIIVPDNCPYLIYGIGLARSGTTVSLNVMAGSTTVDASGTKYPIECGYQHFKAGYRHAMHGWPNDSKTEPWYFRIPEAGNHKVFYRFFPKSKGLLCTAWIDCSLRSLLPQDDVKYIEAICHEEMTYLGYQPDYDIMPDLHTRLVCRPATNTSTDQVRPVMTICDGKVVFEK